MQQKNKALAIGMIAFMMMSAIGILEVGEVRGEGNYIPHEPIYINGNENFTKENGVKSGNGNQDNPFIIEKWDINGSGKNMSAIYIGNTTKYFIIRNCYLHDSDLNGIYFENVKNGKIENCEIKNNSGGIDFDYSSNNEINHNNLKNSHYGILLSDSSNNNIISNNLNNIMFYVNGIDGIALAGSHKNTIFNNTISGNMYGIQFITYSKNNKITNNTIFNNQNGISIGRSSDNNSITDNIIYNNEEVGINFEHGYLSDNNSIMRNVINNNSYGIYFYESSNNSIIQNNISDNKYYGIYMNLYSNNSIIKYNNISNSQYGIYIQDFSSNNNIYLNNFINNTNQAYSDYNSNNNWDYNEIGNYWSDYKGEDKNKDGIGDTPYLISGGNNKDNYPLMKPVNNSTVPNNQKTQTTSHLPNSTLILYAISVIAILSLSGVVVRFFRRNRNS